MVQGLMVDAWPGGRFSTVAVLTVPYADRVPAVGAFVAECRRRGVSRRSNSSAPLSTWPTYYSGTDAGEDAASSG